MRWRYLMLTLVMVWFASPVHAEFYRYRDKNGVLRFTDNIVDVPKDQRKGANKYETAAPPGEQEQSRAAGEAGSQAAAPAPKPEEPSIEIPPGPEADRLNKIKAELDKEHAELLVKKSALNKETDIYSSNEKFEAYKAKVTRFNLRKEAYEKRVEAFERELEAYSPQKTQSPEAEEEVALAAEAEEEAALATEVAKRRAAQAAKVEAVEAEETETPEEEAEETETEEPGT